MTEFLAWAALAFEVLAVIGSGAILAAAWATRRFTQVMQRGVPPVPPLPVTILKPLYGAEPRLAENLATFRDQHWDAPVQIVAGVQRSDDPAIMAARSIGPTLELVIDPTPHGANAKVGNLINMMPAVQHDMIVLSDSDIAVPPDYLARLAATLAQPNVGVVTCVYAGRGDAGFWSQLGAGMVSYHFLPSVLLSVVLDTGDACMGSTIALRRETLDRIGGFQRFADTLADDHAIGAAARELDLRVAVAPVLVTHASTEQSLAALVRHELRWMATVRAVNPGGHVGALLLHALPMALIAVALSPGWASSVVAGVAIAARLSCVRAVDRLVGRPTLSVFLLPFRDVLTFAMHLASLFIHRVEWRGARLAMRGAGLIEAERA